MVVKIDLCDCKVIKYDEDNRCMYLELDTSSFIYKNYCNVAWIVSVKGNSYEDFINNKVLSSNYLRVGQRGGFSL